MLQAVFVEGLSAAVLSYTVETSLLSLCMAGIHCCSLHHSQSQEEGEGEERKRGGEDGSGKWEMLILRKNHLLLNYL